MRPAKKSLLFSHLFAWHVHRRMRGHFSAVYVEGLEHLRVDRPTVLFVNHSAWWDSLFCFDLVFRTLGRDGYAMMDALSLQRVPLLGWIGGFGVHIGDHEDGSRALAYAAQLLKQPRVVAMFPQGREVPSSVRPLAFKPGLARLLSMAPQAVGLPMGIRYEHGRDEKPFAMISIGPPIEDRSLIACEEALEARLKRIEHALHSRAEWPAHLPARKPSWAGNQR